MKPGYKTTEFWLSLIAQGLGGLVGIGVGAFVGEPDGSGSARTDDMPEMKGRFGELQPSASGQILSAFAAEFRARQLRKNLATAYCIAGVDGQSSDARYDGCTDLGICPLVDCQFAE